MKENGYQVLSLFFIILGITTCTLLYFWNIVYKTNSTKPLGKAFVKGNLLKDSMNVQNEEYCFCAWLPNV